MSVLKILSVATDARLPDSFKIHLEHGRSEYLFVLFKSRAMLLVEEKYMCVDNGMGVFFDKNKVQSYYACKNHEFNHDFLLFDFENDYEEFLFSDVPKGKPFSVMIPDMISDAIHTIRNEFVNHSGYRENILSNAGMIFIYKTINELNLLNIGDKNRNNYKTLRNLRLEIYKNPGNEWSIDEMCKKTCLSRYYLQHLYKEFFEVSCMLDVIHARIEASKALLLNSNYRIAEIAEKCGYKNTEHFMRQFRTNTGTTPNSFRNN